MVRATGAVRGSFPRQVRFQDPEAVVPDLLLVDALPALRPELTEQDALQVTAALILLTASAWPSCTPTEAAAAAFAADPALAPLHMSFTDVLGRTLTLTITGLLAERGVLPGR
ncbi:hypothetical protein [Corynebacterium nuruki]|uniref:Tetracyclin repressor-like C-terminal domain-containing protein n=1 Tax=Corynebacterium nuruki TaxID=1032851 RepID=A0A3D4SZW0_9CORY|nr:hypothetical protein [Corynebacterium nuruki]HCT14809.1 hypothetical protein [Corynebacterium nuruki]